jgi:hypothetical protein
MLRLRNLLLLLRKDARAKIRQHRVLVEAIGHIQDGWRQEGRGLEMAGRNARIVQIPFSEDTRPDPSRTTRKSEESWAWVEEGVVVWEQGLEERCSKGGGVCLELD